MEARQFRSCRRTARKYIYHTRSNGGAKVLFLPWHHLIC